MDSPKSVALRGESSSFERNKKLSGVIGVHVEKGVESWLGAV
jgi:hypothetical protein